MTRYLLDTNIISNLVKPQPSPMLMSWMAARLDVELFISALTIGEIWRGILALPAGRRRRDLQAWFGSPEGPPTLFQGRVLDFDQSAAMVWARLMAEGKSAGRPRSALDMLIAAIAEAQDCRLVTDNERDFVGLEFINPLRESR